MSPMDRWKQEELPAEGVGGIALEHIVAFLKVCNEKQCCILIRSVNPTATSLIVKGYPTKPLDLKAKSSDWGPHAGFIPVEPALAKSPSWLIDPNKVTADRALVRAAFGARMQAVPLVIPRARIEELRQRQVINAYELQIKPGRAPLQPHLPSGGLGYSLSHFTQRHGRTTEIERYKSEMAFVALDVDSSDTKNLLGEDFVTKATSQKECAQSFWPNEQTVQRRPTAGLAAALGGTSSTSVLSPEKYYVILVASPSSKEFLGLTSEPVKQISRQDLSIDFPEGTRPKHDADALYLYALDVVATASVRASAPLDAQSRAEALNRAPQRNPRPGAIPYTADYDVFAICPQIPEALSRELRAVASAMTSDAHNFDAAREKFRERYARLEAGTDPLAKQMGVYTNFQMEVAAAMNVAATDRWTRSSESVVNHGAEHHNTFHPQPVTGEVVILLPSNGEHPCCWYAKTKDQLSAALAEIRSCKYYYKQNWVHVLSPESSPYHFDPFGLHDYLVRVPRGAPAGAFEHKAAHIRATIDGLADKSGSDLANALQTLMPVERDTWSPAAKEVLYQIELASFASSLTAWELARPEQRRPDTADVRGAIDQQNTSTRTPQPPRRAVREGAGPVAGRDSPGDGQHQRRSVRGASPSQAERPGTEQAAPSAPPTQRRALQEPHPPVEPVRATRPAADRVVGASARNSPAAGRKPPAETTGSPHPPSRSESPSGDTRRQTPPRRAPK